MHRVVHLFLYVLRFFFVFVKNAFYAVLCLGCSHYKGSMSVVVDPAQCEYYLSMYLRCYVSDLSVVNLRSAGTDGHHEQWEAKSSQLHGFGLTNVHHAKRRYAELSTVNYNESYMLDFIIPKDLQNPGQSLMINYSWYKVATINVY